MIEPVSLNLTTGEHTPVADVSVYAAPVFMAAGRAVCEVVFWSPPCNAWLVLVAATTGREWPPAAQTIEITSDQIAAV